MVNSTYQLLRTIKSAAMGGGRGQYMPPEPLPNSIKAKEIEAQELAAEQSENGMQGVDAQNGQMMEMHKMQEDSMKELQDANMKVQELSGQLQNAETTQANQLKNVELTAQQEIQKAKMEAEFKLQEAMLKNKQDMLSMQEKHQKSLASGAKNQNHILGTQLKRIVKKVNSLKMAATIRVEGRGPADVPAPRAPNPTAGGGGKAPHTEVPMLNRTPEMVSERQKYYADRVKTVTDALPPAPGAMSATKDFASDITPELHRYWGDPKKYSEQAGLRGNPLWDATLGFTDNVNSGFSNLARGNVGQGAADLAGGYAHGALNLMSGGAAVNGVRLGLKSGLGLAGGAALPSIYGQLAPGSGQGAAPNTQPAQTPINPGYGGAPGFSAPAPMAGGTGLTPQEQFGSQDIGSSDLGHVSGPQAGSDLSQFMGGQSSLASPMPILQSGLKHHEWARPIGNFSNQQGYGGEISNFIRNLIFQGGMPAMGMPAFGQPNFSQVYGSLGNPRAYKLQGY